LMGSGWEQFSDDRATVAAKTATNRIANEVRHLTWILSPQSYPHRFGLSMAKASVLGDH